jgi:hypothetical protein
VIAIFGAQVGPGTATDAGEGVEVVDEMRLIAVAESSKVRYALSTVSQWCNVETIREPLKVRPRNLVENGAHGLLNDLSSSTAIPNGRWRPSAFWDYTLLDGCAR